MSQIDIDTDKIWSLMSEMDEEDVDEVLKNMSEEQLLHFRTKFNCMQKPKTTPYMKGKNKILAFSIVNVREIYARRFAMTSMIGYSYQMKDEWEPQEPIDGIIGDDLVSQNDPEFANIFNVKNDELLKKRPIEIYNKIISETKEKIDKFGNTDNDEELSTVLNLYEKLYKNEYRLNRFQHFCNNKILKELVKKLEVLENEKIKYEISIKMERKRLAVVESKLALRKKFEGSEMQKNFIKHNNQKIDRNSEAEFIDNYLENPKTIKLSKNDKLQSVEIFEAQLFNKNSIINNSHITLTEVEEKLIKLKQELNSIKKIMSTFLQNIADTKNKYKQIFGEINSLESVSIDEYDITDEEYAQLLQECKDELHIKITKEEFYEKNRSIIKMFLDDHFKYNPNNHVQCAYKPNYDDELRIPLTQAYKKYVNKDSTREEYTKAYSVFDNEIEKLQRQCEKKYERSVIPPADTFCRWNRYTDNNFEYIKQATDDIYCEKSDLDLSILPLADFEKETDEKTQEVAEEWQRKHAPEFETAVFRATYGIHNLLGPWTENREKTNFYTKKTQIIKSIIDQSQEDARIGNKLMKERVKKGKAKNEKKYGKNDKFIDTYKSEGMEDMNVKHIDDLDITQESLKDINNIDESTNDEIEVEYFNIKPDLKNKHRGYVKTGKFHIPAEQKLPETVAMKPSDMHKHIQKKNLEKFMANGV